MSFAWGADPAQPTEEKQCRICLDGPDPLLGRLIRPCLCKGSISYVHVKCLQQWRISSASQSAFYACPQCHYKYRFSRTRALGIAQNPLFVGILSTFFFTCVVYCASFIATYFMDGLDDPQSGYNMFWGSYYFGVSPIQVGRELIKVALRVLRDEDIAFDSSAFNKYSSKASPLYRSTSAGPPSGFWTSFFRRVILGVPVVGVASLVHLLWSMSLLTPFHFLTRGRTRNRREGSRDIATMLILLAIVAGALRALWKVYRLTEKWAKRVLLRAEDVILEVN